MDELKRAKAEATRSEHRRVYEDFNTPRDITVESESGVWVRRLWQSGHRFGWGRWEQVW